jgi:hypothetical protein
MTMECSTATAMTMNSTKMEGSTTMAMAREGSMATATETAIDG